jgi:hypothetical protein
VVQDGRIDVTFLQSGSAAIRAPAHVHRLLAVSGRRGSPSPSAVAASRVLRVLDLYMFVYPTAPEPVRRPTLIPVGSNYRDQVPVTVARSTPAASRNADQVAVRRLGATCRRKSPACRTARGWELLARW